MTTPSLTVTIPSGSITTNSLSSSSSTIKTVPSLVVNGAEYTVTNLSTQKDYNNDPLAYHFENFDPAAQRTVQTIIGNFQDLIAKNAKISKSIGDSSFITITVELYPDQEDGFLDKIASVLFRTPLPSTIKQTPSFKGIQYENKGKIEEIKLSELGVNRVNTAEFEALAKSTHALLKAPEHIELIANGIKEVGSVIRRRGGEDKNRCLALSIADQELVRINDGSSSIDDCAQKYQFVYTQISRQEWLDEFNRGSDQEKRHMIAEQLISKAIYYLSDQRFLQDAQNNQQGFQVVWNAAIQERIVAKDVPRDINNLNREHKESVVRIYREHMGTPGKMLDLPFLVALNQPFIVIGRRTGPKQYGIQAVSHGLDIANLTPQQLAGINIVFHDEGTKKDSIAHYQSVQVAENDRAHFCDLLREIE